MNVGQQFPRERRRACSTTSGAFSARPAGRKRTVPEPAAGPTARTFLIQFDACRCGRTNATPPLAGRGADEPRARGRSGAARGPFRLRAGPAHGTTARWARRRGRGQPCRAWAPRAPRRARGRRLPGRCGRRPFVGEALPQAPALRVRGTRERRRWRSAQALAQPLALRVDVAARALDERPRVGIRCRRPRGDDRGHHGCRRRWRRRRRRKHGCRSCAKLQRRLSDAERLAGREARPAAPRHRPIKDGDGLPSGRFGPGVLLPRSLAPHVHRRQIPRRWHDRRRHDADDAGRVAQLEVAAAADGAGQRDRVALFGARRRRRRRLASSYASAASGAPPARRSDAGEQRRRRSTVCDASINDLRFRAAAQYPASA